MDTAAILRVADAIEAGIPDHPFSMSSRARGIEGYACITLLGWSVADTIKAWQSLSHPAREAMGLNAAQFEDLTMPAYPTVLDDAAFSLSMIPAVEVADAMRRLAAGRGVVWPRTGAGIRNDIAAMERNLGLWFAAHGDGDITQRMQAKLDGARAELAAVASEQSQTTNRRAA